MPLTGKDSGEIASLEADLLKYVPSDGRGVGNARLRDDCLGWQPDLYLAVRKRLIDSGKIILGRGRGGSVRLAPNDAIEDNIDDDDVHRDPYPNEESLYDEMLAPLSRRWVNEQPFDQHIVERTDRGGRRADGVWSRPDITVAAMTSYTYVPGRYFDIVTFEVKHHSSINVTAVYEALAHRRSATKAYVLFYIPDELMANFEVPALAEVGEECTRHGIGLIVAGDPKDYDTWEVREDATRVAPDPAKMNTFIRNQLSEGTRDQIVRWFRV